LSTWRSLTMFSFEISTWGCTGHWSRRVGAASCWRLSPVQFERRAGKVLGGQRSRHFGERSRWVAQVTMQSSFGFCTWWAWLGATHRSSRILFSSGSGVCGLYGRWYGLCGLWIGFGVGGDWLGLQLRDVLAQHGLQMPIDRYQTAISRSRTFASQCLRWLNGRTE
jgi:hypothetical protein